MTAFALTELVNDPLAQIESAALGVDASNPLVQNDVGKAVKRAANNNFVLCTENDEIEGFVSSIEPYTVNDGFSFGSVQLNRRMIVEVGANEAGTLAVGELVVADAQAALGTAANPMVKKGVPAAQSGTTPFAYTERTPNTFLWQVIRIVTGTGVTGDTVLIERI